MVIERGHVINARFPHASGTRGKKRPVVVVQANVYNARLRHAVVVQLTTNLDDKDDPACFLLEAGTPEGQAAGILQDSLFSGYPISLMSEDRLQDVIGKLSDEAMLKVDACLKTAMGILYQRTRPLGTHLAAANVGIAREMQLPVDHG